MSTMKNFELIQFLNDNGIDVLELVFRNGESRYFLYDILRKPVESNQGIFVEGIEITHFFDMVWRGKPLQQKRVEVAELLTKGKTSNIEFSAGIEWLSYPS